MFYFMLSDVLRECDCVLFRDAWGGVRCCGVVELWRRVSRPTAKKHEKKSHPRSEAVTPEGNTKSEQMVGIEPTTLSLAVTRSTAEPHLRRPRKRTSTECLRGHETLDARASISRRARRAGRVRRLGNIAFEGFFSLCVIVMDDLRGFFIWDHGFDFFFFFASRFRGHG